MSKYSYISISEAGLLIDKEIFAAKGATEKKSLKFFTTKDVQEIAEKLVERKERSEKCTVRTILIDPIGVPMDNYLYKYMEDPTLNEDKLPKLISIVVPDQTIKRGKESEYLFKLRKQLLKNPTNFIFGLMKDIREKRIGLPTGLNVIALSARNDDLSKHPIIPLGIRAYENKVSVFFDFYKEIPNTFPSLTGILCEDFDL